METLKETLIILLKPGSDVFMKEKLFYVQCFNCAFLLIAIFNIVLKSKMKSNKQKTTQITRFDLKNKYDFKMCLKKMELICFAVQ